MNNILREIFWAVLMVRLPIATACVKKAAASIGASAEENAKSEVTRRLVQEISGGDTVGYLTTRIQAQISRNKGVSK